MRFVKIFFKKIKTYKKYSKNFWHNTFIKKKKN